MVKLFPRIYEGTHVRHPAVEVIRAREVVLEPWDAHPAAPDAHGDGERIGALPLTVRVEAGGLQVLA